jgi:hypothetical protein
MSIRPSPKTRNVTLNTTFNNEDYIQTNSGGSGLIIAQTDSKYLQISGVANSSAQTTFQNTVDFKSLLTVDDIKVITLATLENVSVRGLIDASNINVSGNIGLARIDTLTVAKLLKSKQSSDTLTSDVFRSDQLHSFNNGMVYSIISDSTTVNSVSFINIPTTINQSYIFTFILRPSSVNSPFYVRWSSNSIKVNGVSIPLYGLQNVFLPSSYTYIVQSISIIYNIHASTPQFVALTSVSAY